MAQLVPPPHTVSCFSKIQTGFTFLVPAHPGSPGQRAVEWVCVCMYQHCKIWSVSDLCTLITPVHLCCGMLRAYRSGSIHWRLAEWCHFWRWKQWATLGKLFTPGVWLRTAETEIGAALHTSHPTKPSYAPPLQQTVPEPLCFWISIRLCICALESCTGELPQ